MPKDVPQTPAPRRSRAALLVLAAGALMLGACATPGQQSQTKAPAVTADLILTNAKVVTLDAASSTAQAVAVRDGRVLAVGSAGDIGRLAGGTTRTLDLQGRTVIPGLMDSHVHVSGIGASTFTDAQIGDARSIPEVLAIIAAAAAKKAPGEWVVVSGDLRHTRIKERRYPTRAELDAVATNNPVLVPTGHLSTANSLALQAAGITRDTPDPVGGLIRRDASGEPTGVLESRAAALVSALIPPRDADMKMAILSAQQKLVRMGMTSLREPGVSLDVLQAYRQLNSENRLLVRSSVALRPRAFDDTALRQIESWAPEKAPGDDMLKVWGIKLAVDGGLVLTNAGLMKEPYLDKPGYRGVQSTPTEALYRMISTANRVGLPVTVHATGDAGMETVMEIYDRVSAEKDIRGKRFAIEHADLPTPRSLELMRKLQVVASVQPSMLTTAPAILLDQLGPARAATFLPYQTYKQYGIAMAGGSDAPAFEVNPYHGIWSVVTRKVRTADVVVAPRQRLTREEALRLYVQGGAYLTFEENVKGSIEPGKLADFAVLSEDIMTVDEDRIPAITPVLTIVGGRIVYDAAAPQP
jgi:predicted amidohydrolase YtcJ